MLGTREASNIMLQLRAQASLSPEAEMPCWIGAGQEYWRPSEILSCKNVLVHIPSLVSDRQYSRPVTPRFFTTAALEFDFDAAASRPDTWLHFLDEVLPNQHDSISTLQEWFGYCLTANTRQQKILMLIGPPRSGKGTIARVLRHLVGTQNVTGPSLASFTRSFGLEPLLGKSLAVISDARLCARNDTAVVIERLLNISGEDVVTIDRKYKSAVHTILPTRLMILSNELLRLGDASNALASRNIIVPCSESFLGREDTSLTTRLLSELPGILLWAIEGWRRLHERGHFVEPCASAPWRDDLERLNSPVRVFVRERCRVAADASVSTTDVYREYQQWCQEASQHAPSQAVFAKDLRAVVPQISSQQARGSVRRYRRYLGIGLLTDHDPP
jgi:putative DNA primase/helicase